MKALALILTTAFTSIANAQVTAFIGSPLSVERSEKSCLEYIEQPDPETKLETICMDRAFLLKYEVTEILVGSSNSGVISFVGFYHYSGMPHYTTYDPALIIVSPEKGYLQLRHIEPAEKRDGVWWVCQEWSELENEQCTKEAKSQDVVAEIAQEI